MFGIGGAEIAIVAVVALLLFGPDKIPQIMRTVRKAVEMYSDARTQVTEVVNTQIVSPEDREFLKDPLGLKGMKTSVDSMLTPERTNLYQQTQTPSRQPLSSSVAASIDATAHSAVSPVPEIQATADTDAAGSLSGSENTPLAASAGTDSDVDTLPATKSAAGSIWASLEQDKGA